MREILSLKLPFGSFPLIQKQKRADLSVNPFVVFGGAEGDRTPDPKTASLVLSQLSYSPIDLSVQRGDKFNIMGLCCQEKILIRPQ
jgi:hypothetical protein